MITIDHSNNTIDSENQNGRYLFNSRLAFVCSKCLIPIVWDFSLTCPGNPTIFF